MFLLCLIDIFRKYLWVVPLRISKYKNIFAKGYTPNWSNEVFVIIKTKNTVSWTYVIMNLNGE